MKKLIVAVLMLAAFTGCNEVAKTPEGIRPLGSHLMPLTQEWKDAYGESLESKLTYNIAVLRNNELVIAKVIKQNSMALAEEMEKLHASDPNDIAEIEDIKCRIDDLEEWSHNPNKLEYK